MKILVIQDRLRSGGTERQSILLTREFTAAGHAATLLLFRPAGALEIEARGIVYRPLLPFDSHLDWFAPGLFPAVTDAAPDIVLCMGRMANCYAGLIQRYHPRIAVVATMRTGKPLPLLFRRGLRRVRHVIANSRAARGALVERHGVDPGKITLIPNALLHPPVAPAERNVELRRQLGAGDNTLVLLNVAMFRPEKNQYELIKLCGRLPPCLKWHLWLAGDGPMRTTCERFVAGHGLGEQVKFVGYHADPRPYYRAADVAVLTSQSESLSNFLCEAQAHGLPAVAYDVVGTGECFVPGESGILVPNRDGKAFLDSVQKLAFEPATRERFAVRARAHAAANFDPGAVVRAHLELFARLAT
ncbi:MAG: hypothetical protein A3G75_16595 [Verrucomicrobia bacterium RIFCSPLOWO2_12_FULL_64_8]|nr:MAG: hypothetical protein A3G75_16595 [Verrucomicrobia bacterium RIFCSPLOWO2_12_FULL_64_8]